MKPLFNTMRRKAIAKRLGDEAENTVLNYLQDQGLRLLARNYRTPGRGGGEIDLILRERDGTCVFVEVRSRASGQFGGAAASVGLSKRQRIVLAAQHFLLRLPSSPPCRFDVVQVQAGDILWLKAAFDASAGPGW